MTYQGIPKFPPYGSVGELFTSILREMSMMVGIVQEEGLVGSCRYNKPI